MSARVHRILVERALTAHLDARIEALGVAFFRCCWGLRE